MNCAIGVPVTRVKYLAETLRSIGRQTLLPAEVIVVDNAADGDVEEIVRAAGLANARIVKRSARLGPIENWNSLLREVKAEWFILLSDDDYLEPTHLAQLAGVLAAHPSARVAHTRVRLVDETGQSLGLTPLSAAWQTRLDWLWHRAKGWRLQFLSEFVWHVETLCAAKGFADLPVAWGSDDLTLFRVAKQGGIAYGSLLTLNYRFHAQSISSSYSVRLKLEAVKQLFVEYRQALLADEPTADSADERLLRRKLLQELPRYEARQQRYLLRQVPLGQALPLLLGRGKHGVSLATWCKAIVDRMRRRSRPAI